MISMCCHPAEPSCESQAVKLHEITVLDSTGGQNNQGSKWKGVGPCYQKTTLLPNMSSLVKTACHLQIPTKVHKAHLANSKPWQSPLVSAVVDQKHTCGEFGQFGVSNLKYVFGWKSKVLLTMTSVASWCCTLNSAQVRSRESFEKSR